MKRNQASARSIEPIFITYNMDHETTGAHAQVADASVVDVARAVSGALEELGRPWQFVELRDSVRPITFAAARCGIVFNLVESLGGDCRRETEVPAALRRAKIPFTGNEALTLARGLDKGHTRRLLDEFGVPVPRGAVVRNGAEAVAMAARRRLRFPLFVKGAHLDASIAVTQDSVVSDAASLRAQVDLLGPICGSRIVIEEYLPGLEINVAGLPMGTTWQWAATAIDFSSFGDRLHPIVTYDCKWNEGTEEYAARSVAAEQIVDATTLQAATQAARRALIALGATGPARVDLRLDAGGAPRVIDVNPNPDLHPEAGYALGFRGRGIDYPHLVDTIVQGAIDRQTHAYPPIPIRRSRGAASAPRSHAGVLR